MKIAPLFFVVAVLGCSGSSHNAGASSPAQSDSIVGVWRSDCQGATARTSKTVELTFLAGGQMIQRQVYFSDKNCLDLDAVKTEDVSDKDAPNETYAVITRYPHPRGTLIFGADSRSPKRYSYAILKNTDGLELTMTSEKTGEIETFTRVSY